MPRRSFDPAAPTYWLVRDHAGADRKLRFDWGVQPARRDSRFDTFLVRSLASGVSDMDFLKELWAYVSQRKKFWMLPIIISLALIGALLIFAQGSVVAPFIYTLF